MYLREYLTGEMFSFWKGSYHLPLLFNHSMGHASAGVAVTHDSGVTKVFMSLGVFILSE
jgi:hypothetical protein